MRRISSVALSALLSLPGWLLAADSRAELLQIIHTNDLHSQFDHSHDPNRGGYAAVKWQIDQLRERARLNGIDTLVLDGGDFLEGSQYYFVDEGAYSFQALDAMGYDAVVIGNHDWLMGPRDLDGALGKAAPRFPLLGANFIYQNGHRNIARHMKPYVEFDRAGARVAVLGLTTDSVMYDWKAGGGFIYNPIWTAREELPKLRSRNDFVIALTHLGKQTDRELVRHTDGIDLVVGGHSHTEIHEPVYEKSRGGRVVPIVQAGSWGEVVGDLLVDITPGKPLKILRYQLIPVTGDTPKDPLIHEIITEAREALLERYGREWMTTPIGTTEVPLAAANDGPTVWGNFIAETIRSAVNADLSLDTAPFSGKTHPVGPITPESLLAAYPRLFDFGDRYGWTIWTNRVRGFWLWAVLKSVLKGSGAGFSVAGVSYRIEEKNGDRRVKDLRIGGRRIGWFRRYTMAFPEGISRGADEISETLKIVLKDPRDSRIPIWLALERKVRQVGVIREEDWLP